PRGAEVRAAGPPSGPPRGSGAAGRRGGCAMKAVRNVVVGLALAACLGLASSARADEMRVEVTGVDPNTVVVRAPDGDELGPGSARLFPPEGALEDADYTITSEDAVTIDVPLGTAFTVAFTGGSRGFGVAVREVRG